MFKSRPDIVREMVLRNKNLSEEQIEQVVDTITIQLCQGLVNGQRVELRDFAAFKVKHYLPRTARNPRTGDNVKIGDRFKASFQPGKKLREMVNDLSEQDGATGKS